MFLGEKQVKKYQLRSGDIVSLGAHELIYTDLRQSGAVNDDDTNEIEDLEIDDDEASVVGE